MEIGGTRERNLHEILLCWGIFDVLIEMPRALLICRRTLALFINKCFNFKTATKALHARELQIPFAQRFQHAQHENDRKKGTTTTACKCNKSNRGRSVTFLNLAAPETSRLMSWLTHSSHTQINRHTHTVSNAHNFPAAITLLVFDFNQSV